ncbi:MAG TPA: site-specific DNA-methyltransferase [Bacteroidales bacterium]|nr:site-specific DNA-methyltransferase [Bacteroidales bacterium]HRT72305.1 site-specific DNA-methyltransferase [Bacteroidales bacterium]
MKNDIILCGDVYAGLSFLKDDSISVAITSPPYWQQRDYNFDEQIGQENTPNEYIGRLIKIFNILKTKLKDDGVFFLNVGDKYLNKYGKSHLLQIPYRLAYHMVNDGWYLQDIIIWYKTNHMPSSVTDRFTNTYEPVFVFAKNKNNIYKNSQGTIFEIALQQTKWKHTAVYPEKLVLELLNKVNIKDDDIILDPFAGTGTTAAVVKSIRNNLFSKNIYSISIEKGEEFVNIIKERTQIEKIIKIKEIDYQWERVTDIDLNENIETKVLLNDKYGEVFIAENSTEFLSIIKGLYNKDFKSYHREDAVHFLGVKFFNLDCLYFIHNINNHGYVLRNMIIVSDDNNWYPVFMIVNDSTRVQYRFCLDRLRVEPKTVIDKNWSNQNFIGTKVINNLDKHANEGYIIDIIEKYSDNFPKLVMVNYNNNIFIEPVLHLYEDDFLMEGLLFFCPHCKSEINDFYDPIEDNYCPHCKQKLYDKLENFPIIKEPNDILELFEILDQNKNINFDVNTKIIKKPTNKTNSKFNTLPKINWGASPGARKLMMGEYFSKNRLYKVSQPLVAQYLTLLRIEKNMTINDVINYFPSNYKHTVGHWFRKDFGGSIPIPQDIIILKNILDDSIGLLNLLEKTALKYQTVKTSNKGKNPGDFISLKNEYKIKKYFEDFLFK